ncbi:MAG: 50S ribosomal protein L17 [Candidatus Nealsonbacteria bacterium]
MRKRKKGRKFNRKRDQRKAFLKALASALFLQGKIKTTEARAKEISSFAEKAMTKAKKGDMNAKKNLAQTFSQKIVRKLTADIAPALKGRPGGYTRILKLGPRKSDGAKMAIIEIIKDHGKENPQN